MARLATFDPTRLSVIITHTNADGVVTTHQVSGFSEDNICTIDRQKEAFTLYTGADNTNTRIYNASTSHIVTIPLQQTSKSNDFFQAMFDYDVRTQDGLFQIIVKDTGKDGRSSYYSDEAYIAIVPNTTYGNSMQIFEWQIHCPQMVTFIGGNTPFDDADRSALAALGVAI